MATHFFLSPANQVAGLIGSSVTAVLSFEVPSPTSIASPVLKGDGMCAGSAVWAVTVINCNAACMFQCVTSIMHVNAAEQGWNKPVNYNECGSITHTVLACAFFTQLYSIYLTLLGNKRSKGICLIVSNKKNKEV